MKTLGSTGGVVPRRSLAVVAKFALVVAIAFLTTSCATGPKSSSTPAPFDSPAVGDFGGTNWARPLQGATATTVAGAQAQAGFPVPVPNDPPSASQANLTQAWVVGPAKQVALVFDGGQVVIEMWPWPSYYPDPATRFQQLSASLDASAAVGQVDGQPALVIQPDTDIDQSNRAWVEFEFNGIDVNISSASYSTDTLLQIANTMSAAVGSMPSSTPVSSSHG